MPLAVHHNNLDNGGGNDNMDTHNDCDNVAVNSNRRLTVKELAAGNRRYPYIHPSVCLEQTE